MKKKICHKKEFQIHAPKVPLPSKLDIKIKWFILYLLVIFIPISVCISLWFYVQYAINAERIVEGHLQIKNVIQKVEEEATINSILVNNLKSNTVIQAAAELPDLNNNDKKQIALDLSQILAKYSAQSNLKNVIFVYLRRSDMVITGEGYYTPREYWEKCYSNSDLSFSTWKNIISKNLPVKYNLYSPSFYDKNNHFTYKSFLHTTLINKTGDLTFSVVGIQSTEAISYDQNAGDTYFVIYDDKGELVYGSNNVQKDALPILLQSEADDILRIGGQRYIVKHENAESLGFRFVVAVKFYDVFTRSILPIASICLILLASVASVWFLWRITEKNHNVIESVIAKLRKFKNESASTDEVEIINNVIDRMIIKNQSQERLLSKQQNQFISFNISRLLHGNLKEFAGLREGLIEDDGLAFLSDYFVVAVIIIEDIEEFLKYDSGSSISDESNLVRFAIKNVAEEVIAKGGNKAYFADEEEIATLLISISSENLLDVTEKLLNNCRFLQSFLNQNLKIKTSISISNVFMGVDEIQLAYKQAIETAEYKSILGEDIIITPDDIDIQSDLKFSYTQEQENLLLNLMKSGNPEQAAKLIKNVLALETDQKFQDVKYIQCMIYSIAGTIIRFCNEEKIDDQAFNENEFLEFLMGEKHLDSMKNMLIEAVRNICSEYRSQPMDSLIKRVTKLIEEEYGNPALSVSYIAEHFEFHVAYMSNLFKEKMGIGMLEYINKLRVNKSIELLLTTDYSVNSIAEKVGYLNANTYIRIFKKNMGETPNKFRSSNQI